jgi:phosphoribosylformylglycinamidine cyclo-ligase
VHSNGYSLVRKIVFEAAGLKVHDKCAELGGSIGECLLTPTRLYAKPIRAMLAAVQTPEFAISGLANITGGGIPDNLGRILPPGCRAVVKRGSWPVSPVFDWLQRLGNVAQAEMEHVFNVGVGFVVVCRPTAADAVVKALGEAWVIGEVTQGEVGVEMTG